MVSRGTRSRSDLFYRVSASRQWGGGGILLIAVYPYNRIGDNFYPPVFDGISRASVYRTQWIIGEIANRRPQWLKVTRRPF